MQASASPEGVQQFERMFADAVDVREELEEALGEFMLMGDKAKEVLEEELLKYEAMQVAHSALTDQYPPDVLITCLRECLCPNLEY